MSRHRDQPQFVVVTSMTPHGPLDAPEDAVQRFMAQGLTRNLALLHAMNAGLDQAVGRLREGIDNLDLDRETIFIFHVG